MKSSEVFEIIYKFQPPFTVVREMFKNAVVETTSTCQYSNLIADKGFVGDYINSLISLSNDEITISILEHILPKQHLVHKINVHGVFNLIDTPSEKLQLLAFEVLNTKYSEDPSKCTKVIINNSFETFISLMDMAGYSYIIEE